MADDYLVNYIDEGGGAPDEEHLFEQVRGLHERDAPSDGL